MAKNIPFQGTVILDIEKALLPSGAFSRIQNMRPRRPGFEKRKGHAKQHTTTAHSTKEIINLYQLSKGSQVERHLFAQYDDGHIDKATNNPPTVTTGDFGTQVLAARTNPSPASFSNFMDMCLMSDGAGQHQINTGQAVKPKAFIVYRGTGAIPFIPTEGADYTPEVIDGLSTTYADISSLDRLADFHCLFIISSVPINKINFTLSSFNANDVDSAAIKYFNGVGLQAVSGLTDGTESGGIAFAQDGSIAWTSPTDEVPGYAFGRSGFIYQWSHSHATVLLDSEVRISAVTVEYTGGFQNIQNVWDGLLQDALIAKTYINATTSYNTYAAITIKPGGLTSSDKLYFCSLDPLSGIFLDVGKTPNTTAGTTITSIKVWNGTTFTSLTVNNDGTTGGKKSGFISWNRETTSRKSNFQSSGFYAYWYEIIFSNTLSADLTWKIEIMPYFNINDIYPVGQSNSSWDKRAWYSFNDNYLYGSAKYDPMVLNGDDKVYLPIGDRGNKILAMVPYYNHLFVFTEEKGAEGGYTVVIEPGKTASGYATMNISNSIGIMNAKCAAVQEAANIADIIPDHPVFKALFWLSREGVFKSEGQVLKNISQGISNYFDPLKAECIRVGQESKHWLRWDRAYGILRIGLVSGASATKPNVFLVYDLVTGAWSTDTLGQPLSCMAEIEAASVPADSNASVLQYGGGQDGFVYRLNTTNSDVSTAIDGDVIIELNGQGSKIQVTEEVIVCKSQAAGDITRDIYINGKATSASTRTMSMINANAAYKGARKQLDVVGDHLSVRLRNNTAGQSMHLLEYGLNIKEVEVNAVYE